MKSPSATHGFRREPYTKTCKHPKSKQCHCIDYAIIRQKNWRLCLDIDIKCGAECHTDHQLLRGKFTMTKWFRRGNKITSRRYAVSHLSEAEDGTEMSVETVAARKGWSEESTLEEKWNKVKEARTGAADSVLGY